MTESNSNSNSKKRDLDQLKADNPDVAAESGVDKKAKVAPDAEKSAAAPAASKDDEKKNDMTYIPGADKLHYEVGSCLDILCETFMARLIKESGGKENADKMFETFYKYDIVLQFFSIVANVCMSDGGKLGKKEEAFIRRCAKFWKMPDIKLDEALQGKDLHKEYIVSIGNYWKELGPNLSEAESVTRVNAFKNYVLTYSILAATQDGLIKEEYKTAETLAKNLGLKDNAVKENIEIIKAEKELAKLVRSKFLKK